MQAAQSVHMSNCHLEKGFCLHSGVSPGAGAAGWPGSLGRGGGKGLLLGHFRDVLVAQCYPEVVILVQEHLLHPCLSNATCLVPGEETSPRSSSNPVRFVTDESLRSRPSEGSLSAAGVLHQHLTQQQFLGQGETQSQCFKICRVSRYVLKSGYRWVQSYL